MSTDRAPRQAALPPGLLEEFRSLWKEEKLEEAVNVLEGEEARNTIEEIKELGHEYRYRDQLMVQEFGLSMLGIGVIGKAIHEAANSWPVLAAQLVVLLFLNVIWRHLRNTNQDRRAALVRREVQLRRVGFGTCHFGAGKRRASVPRLMIRFAQVLTLAWTLWTGCEAGILLGWISPG